jgi:hypothetical protein
MAEGSRLRAEDLAWWAGWVAVVELVLLRIGTRTLVHIPGVDVIAGPLAWLSEAGRFAYYLALVLIVGVGMALAASWWVSRSPGRWLEILSLVIFVVGAVAGAIGAVDPGVVGWAGLAALLPLVVGSIGIGRGAIPLLLWTAAVWSSGLAVLLQGRGGGLTGDAVAGFLQAGDILAVAGAVAFPLLLGRRPSRGPLVTGVVVAGVVGALLTWVSSTTAILALWAFGVTASLPPLIYGMAAAGMAVTVHQAVLDRNRRVAAATLLVLAGGIGLVSTYQTGLVLVGLGMVSIGSFRDESAPVPASAPEPELVGAP